MANCFSCYTLDTKPEKLTNFIYAIDSTSQALKKLSQLVNQLKTLTENQFETLDLNTKIKFLSMFLVLTTINKLVLKLY